MAGHEDPSLACLTAVRDSSCLLLLCLVCVYVVRKRVARARAITAGRQRAYRPVQSREYIRRSIPPLCFVMRFLGRAETAPYVLVTSWIAMAPCSWPTLSGFPNHLIRNNNPGRHKATRRSALPTFTHYLHLFANQFSTTYKDAQRTLTGIMTVLEKNGRRPLSAPRECARFSPS